MIYEKLLLSCLLLFILIFFLNYFFIKSIKIKKIINYIKGIFLIVLVLFFIRCFVVEPFRIPSRSMVPTLFDGDFLLSNKFIYGLRIPVLNKVFINISFPKVGDVIIFKHFSEKYYVKRVLGVCGDHIKYNNENLYVNNNLILRSFFYKDVDINSDNVTIFPVESCKEESLSSDFVYNIYLRPWVKNTYIVDDFIVPNKSYFVIGDNRATSFDSRFWGVVNFDDVVGKVLLVWFSWDLYYKNIRWNRIFMIF